VAHASANDVAAKKLSDISASVDEADTMIRRSVHNLDDDGTDFETQITDAVHTMDATSRDFTVSLDCSIKDAPAPVTRCITAVIREALTNAVRHSDSTEATVTLHDYPAFWQLAIFNKTTIKPVPRMSPHDDQNLRGMGLADIQQRIESLGGTAICGPYHDGWRVFASLPKSPWTSRDTNKETTAAIYTEVTI
jgi:signal transduction histidine kinase